MPGLSLLLGAPALTEHSAWASLLGLLPLTALFQALLPSLSSDLSVIGSKRRTPRHQYCLPQAPFPESRVSLHQASKWGLSPVTRAHMHFIVLKPCNSAVLIYEGCISSSDPRWYRTHYFPFMCLCQRATGDQLLETGLKKKKEVLYYCLLIPGPQYLPPPPFSKGEQTFSFPNRNFLQPLDKFITGVTQFM